MRTFVQSAPQLLACAMLVVTVSPSVALAGALPHQLTVTPTLSVRLRQESASQDGLPHDASSTTLRHRLGLNLSGPLGVSGLLESEGVVSLFDQNYNSGPEGNGRTQYPVVADPAGNQLNQAYMHWQASDTLGLRLGRQRIIHDKARFIGNVGWRQNEQTFDAASLNWHGANSVAAQYAYLRKVNRIFFDSQELEGHLLSLSFTRSSALGLSAYVYLLDYQNPVAEDTQTLGVRATGKPTLAGRTWLYTVEYAIQQDYADSQDIDSFYSSVEIGGVWQALTLLAGQELLSGDGARGLSTPLATLHAYNGWADKFLATPANGLRDRYLQAAYTAKPWKLIAVYHDFAADKGASNYGRELDLLLTYQLCKHSGLTFKYADYSADSFATDTRRLIAQLDFKL